MREALRNCLVCGTYSMNVNYCHHHHIIEGIVTFWKTAQTHLNGIQFPELYTNDAIKIVTSNS